MTSITPLVAMQGTIEKMAPKFREALPPTMDELKFISVLKLTLNKNQKLLQADQNSLLQTFMSCLLYTSPSPRDLSTSRMPSSA